VHSYKVRVDGITAFTAAYRTPSFFWNKQQEGYCVPIDVIIALTFLYSACAIISDFTFAILPIFLIWGLNMPAKTRIMLIPVLGMACV
jgi:hypothetical protein